MYQLTWTGGVDRVECKVCRRMGDGAAIATIRGEAVDDIQVVTCPHCGSIDLVDDPAESGPTDQDVDDYVEAGAGISTIAAGLGVVDPSTVSKFLDVGCGYGFALDLARHLYGWKVVGVDPSFAAGRGVADLGLDIRREEFTADTDLGGSFDLILASEVLEHVVDPAALLTAVRGQLAVEGTLVLTTPAAEIVVRESAVPDVLCALSPGNHAFVASERGLALLLEGAGFSDWAIVRVGGTLRATAVLQGTAPPPDRSVVGSDDVLGYLQSRLDHAAPDSALAVGMSVRLTRALVAAGRLADAAKAAIAMKAALLARYGTDLDEPAALLRQVESGHRAPWPAVSAAYSLGVIALQQEDHPRRAADYFAVAATLGEVWWQALDIADLDTADLRFQGAYHRALALTRFAPQDAAREVLALGEGFGGPALNDDVDGKCCRIFVELVARGHYTGIDALIRRVESIAVRTARSSNDDLRVAGLDALFSLGMLKRNTGDLIGSQEALLDCMAHCDARPAADAHAAHLTENCRDLLAAPAAPRRSRLRARTRARGSLIGPSVKWFIDTFWTDTWGTYLDGWAHLEGTPVHRIAVDAGGMRIVAERRDRPELAETWSQHPEVVHGGFSVYVPGRVTFPVRLVLTTDAGEVAAEVDLPPRQRPELPNLPAELPDRRFVRAMAEAPDGPALFLGSRSKNAEIAEMRKLIWFGDRESVGFDIHPGHGVDVVGDAHQLSSLFDPDHFSVVYSEALLEHVTAPWLVAAECAKVLKPGGLAIHIAPWVWPTHSEPNDFWRFSDQGLRSLFGLTLGFRVIGSGGSGGSVISPVPDWRHQELRFPTYVSPAMSWVIAEKIAEPAEPPTWPYLPSDAATALEYPVDGLSIPHRSVIKQMRS